MTLTVSDLACARGGIPVIEGINFVLPPGRAMALRGPNGIGKTTLLRTLAGLQPPLIGRIDAPADAIAYAAHADGLKSVLTVAENLEFWAQLFGTSGIGSALAAFNLTELAQRPARALSAGQRRRLGLARLLVTGRTIWLLDEPTVSLDAASVGLFATVLHSHLAGGGSALIATHVDLGIAMEEFDLSLYRARPRRSGAFDEAFV